MKKKMSGDILCIEVREMRTLYVYIYIFGVFDVSPTQPPTWLYDINYSEYK